MRNDQPKRYVFVGGLHRSGTSVLAFNIGRMQNCTAFENTGVGMDEGQHLQKVYPTDVAYGGIGRFAFDPRAHLTESSELLTRENIEQLHASWHSWWDAGKSICVEKTPGNMIMGRFLQAAFPNSCFVIVRRHPVAACLASQKWSRTSLHQLVRHWVLCHDIFLEDRKFLREVYELTYEDYIIHPAEHHQKIAGLIGAGQSLDLEPITESHNRRYMEQWARMLESGWARGYHLFVAAKYEAEVNRYGYSFFTEMKNGEELRRRASRIGAVRGAILCACADVAAFFWRHGAACKRVVKFNLFGNVPEVNRIHRQGGPAAGSGKDLPVNSRQDIS